MSLGAPQTKGVSGGTGSFISLIVSDCLFLKWLQNKSLINFRKVFAVCMAKNPNFTFKKNSPGRLVHF